MENYNQPWVIKYQPTTVDQMVLTQQLKDLFNNFITDKSLQGIILYGNPGIGKSLLSKILINSIDCEYIFQNCSTDSGKDMILSEVLPFCNMRSAKVKIVVLDEADGLSSMSGTGSSAQMSLRNIIPDTLDDTRFIMTCNYPDKIIPALKSRCTPIKLQYEKKDLIQYLIQILDGEKINYTKSSLSNYYNICVKPRLPDIRSVVENLQLSCTTGTLQILDSTKPIIDNEIIQYIVDNQDYKQIRMFLVQNEDKFSGGDYIQLTGQLFNYYQDNRDALILIADYLYKMSMVIDKEIQFTSMIVQLKELLKR